MNQEAHDSKPMFHGDDGSEWITANRTEFEQWFVTNSFDYASHTIGSRLCDLQWRAWQASRAQFLSGLEALAGEWDRDSRLPCFDSFDRGYAKAQREIAARISALIPAAENTESEETKS